MLRSFMLECVSHIWNLWYLQNYLGAHLKTGILHPHLESSEDPNLFHKYLTPLMPDQCALQNALVDDLTVNLMKSVMWMKKCDWKKKKTFCSCLTCDIFLFIVKKPRMARCFPMIDDFAAVETARISEKLRGRNESYGATVKATDIENQMKARIGRDENWFEEATVKYLRRLSIRTLQFRSNCVEFKTEND